MQNTETHGDWVRELVDAYQSQLLSYAWRIVGRWDRAQDVVQDTFLKLCQQEPAFIRGHAVKWLYTVCRNRALDVAAKEQRMKVDDELARNHQLAMRHSPDHLEQADDISQMMDLIEQLPAKQQEVLRLKFHAGLSYKDIADLMDTTAGYVGRMLCIAMKELRQLALDAKKREHEA